MDRDLRKAGLIPTEGVTIEGQLWTGVWRDRETATITVRVDLLLATHGLPRTREARALLRAMVARFCREWFPADRVVWKTGGPGQ